MLQRLFERVVQRPLERAQNINVVKCNLGSINNVYVVGDARGEVELNARLNVLGRVAVVIARV